MKMKKFINAPENLAPELLEGLAAAYPQKIKLEGKVVVRAQPKSKDKVAIITLGGAGHEPALSGFVGYGMLDASIVGDIFAAPNAVAVFEGLKKFKDYAGILLVVLNHAGDVMSANMAMKMAAEPTPMAWLIWELMYEVILAEPISNMVSVASTVNMNGMTFTAVAGLER